MAHLLWGEVYYQNHFAGILQEEPGESSSFTYESSYLNSGHPSIAHTLPLQAETYFTKFGLPAFFDNLVAEGWLESAQRAFLGKRVISRFNLLLAFGYDCAGAVSVMDPEPRGLSEIFLKELDSKTSAVLTSRASLSGIQPKLTIVKKNGKYMSSKIGELSTHIAKFPSSAHDDLVMNEYLTMQAFKALLPEDSLAEFFLGEIAGISEQALIITRFDRKNGSKIHFEEFNQLLNKKSSEKYNGTYEEISQFMSQTKGCLPTERYRLFARILAGLLLGNTDMHFKNFSMFHTPQGLRLTPSYDQVAAILYQYKTIALALGGATDILITHLKPKHIVALASAFQLSKDALEMLIKQLTYTKEVAKEAIFSAPISAPFLKDSLIQHMEKRWNGTFSLIGQTLLMKP